MPKPVKAISVLTAFCVFGTMWLLAQSQAHSALDQRKLTFVQNFYDWYSRQPQYPWPLDIVIKQRPYLFDQPLLQALQKDAYARAHAKGEIDGLDWDPFENGQYPPSHYKATQASGNFVTIIGYDENISKPVVSLQAEVNCTSTHCVFANFHYPASGNLNKFDLLATLKLLHPDQETGR